ncbi:hypothetical protein CCAE64S_02438 [Castellaniella caeni]
MAKPDFTNPTKWPFRSVSYEDYKAMPPDLQTRLDHLVLAFILGAAPCDEPPTKAKPQKKKTHLRLVKEAAE